MPFKTMSRNDLRKSSKRHSERPGDLMKNLETPGWQVWTPGDELYQIESGCSVKLVVQWRKTMWHYTRLPKLNLPLYWD